MEKHHEAMLEHVTEIFHRYDNITDRKRPFRNKLDHTLRVLAWVRRIAMEEGGDLELLTTCAIFHDVGYTVDPPNHPAVSARMCDEYLAARGFDEEYRAAARRIISGHGDKSRLVPETPLDELILIEADNLEEKGALDILWDVLEEGRSESPSYENAWRRINAHAQKRQKNIMVTETARRFWRERSELMQRFADELALEMGREW